MAIIPKISLPSKIYTVVGKEFNLWYDALVLGTDAGLQSPKEYSVEIICAHGTQKERSFSITPSAGQVGSHLLTVNIYDYNHDLLISKVATLIVTSNTMPVSNKNLLIVGDSITANGELPVTLKDNFASLGNTVTMVGSKGSGATKYEATGGYAFWTYVSTSSPFYNPGTGLLDISYYRTQIGIAPAKIDVVTIQLGVNESLGTAFTANSLALIIADAKTLIQLFLTDNANTKIVLILPSSDGNTKGGWGTNYGAVASKNLYQDNIFILRDAFINNFDNNLYHANVYVSCASYACDRYYGYELDDVSVSTRYSTTEKVHVNAVHPTTSGYEQMADGLIATIMPRL